MTSAALRVLTNANDATANQRRANGVTIMGKSIDARGDYCRPPTTVVENYFDERELREEFATLIADLTPRQIAKASGCTIDAAKMWLAGRRLPNMASTFNMSQRIPRVNQWVQRRGGIGTVADAQKELLRQMVAEEVQAVVKKPPDDSHWHPDNVVRDMFDRRRA